MTRVKTSSVFSNTFIRSPDSAKISMKRLLSIIIIIIAGCLTCSAQDTFEPQMLILSPGNFTFDPALQKEVDKNNADLKKMAAQILNSLYGPADERKGQPANAKLMLQSTAAFVQNLDVSKQFSIISQEYLVYRFLEKFPNCLLLVKDEKSNGSQDDLKKIAIEEQAPYVLNFSKAFLYKQNGQTFCKVQIQLYEQQSNKLLIDKEYTGDWNNPGFEFTCEQGSIGCTISNALSFALPEVISAVATNNPTLKREKELAKKRSEYIATTVYPMPFDESRVRKTISASDIDVNLNDLYQCIYSADDTKFVAFFIKIIDPKDAKPILTEKKDSNVTIVTSKDIHDPGYLDQSPRTYAYILRGILYQNKWYAEKSEVTYFDANNLREGKINYLNNLQKWDYFADNSDEPDKGFWEGNLFEKIKDKRKDSDWGKYKDMWETEERDNRDYIGQYELVADELKKEKELADDTFRSQLITNSLIPFYNNQIKLKLNHILKADASKRYNLIYPKDAHVVLNPIKITDEKGVSSVRYFVFLPHTNEVFEWTLLTPHILRKDEFANDPIFKAMNAITKWNYSYKTLDDDAFWNEKVLAKDGSNYKYLKKLQ